MESTSQAELEQGSGALRAKEHLVPGKDHAKRSGKALKLPFGPDSWIAALQLTAALVVFGFITKLSHEQLLGIQLSDWSALNLTLFAGRCAVDTLRILLEQPWPHVVLACLLATPLATYIALPLQHRFSRPSGLASLGVAVGGLLVVLVWNEVPTLKMANWLTLPIETQLYDGSGDGLIASRETELRASLFIWKLDGFAGDGGGAVEVHCTDRGTATPAVLQRYMVQPSPSVGAQRRLESIYAASVFFCVLGWLVVCLPPPATKFVVEQEVVRLVRAGVILALLPAVTVLLPYMYGKLLISTDFPLANMVLKVEEDSDSAAGAKPKETVQGKAGKTRWTKDAGILLDGEQVLLIDQTDKDLTILRAPNDKQEIPSLIVVPRDDVAAPIQLHAPQDVILQSILHNCGWLPLKPVR